jgi:hypothetical protein
MARTGTTGLTAQQLRGLARAGAEVTLNRLRAEIAAIESAFPELVRRGAVRQQANADGSQTPRRRRRRISAAARKAVSERMRRYWAERRKAKAKAK